MPPRPRAYPTPSRRSVNAPDTRLVFSGVGYGTRVYALNDDTARPRDKLTQRGFRLRDCFVLTSKRPVSERSKSRYRGSGTQFRKTSRNAVSVVRCELYTFSLDIDRTRRSCTIFHRFFRDPGAMDPLPSTLPLQFRSSLIIFSR